MQPLHPEVMVRQAEALAGDLRDLTAVHARQVDNALKGIDMPITAVYLTGDGDSYHAACAAEMAFETIAGVNCEPLSAQRFLDYGSAALPSRTDGVALVIATSASGGTDRVLQAIQRAREHGALTIALTGVADSPVTRAADRTILVELPRPERSPGIRTYQASLVGMLLTAIQLAGEEGDAYLLRREIAGLAEIVDATNRAIDAACRDLAAIVARSPAVMMLGTGPSYGTALFSAAKLIEGAGILALGQDLEEWLHVERLAHPIDLPVFVIAPPGRSHWRVEDVAASARALGKYVVTITKSDDNEVMRHAHVAVAIQGDVREEFSPLLYHLFAPYVASYAAEQLNRVPFLGDRPGLRQALAEYRSRL